MAKSKGKSAVKNGKTTPLRVVRVKGKLEKVCREKRCKAKFLTTGKAGHPWTRCPKCRGPSRRAAA